VGEVDASHPDDPLRIERRPQAVSPARVVGSVEGPLLKALSHGGHQLR
jgi:hypothetical protein